VWTLAKLVIPLALAAAVIVAAATSSAHRSQAPQPERTLQLHR